MDNIFATKFNFGQVVMTPGFEQLSGPCLKQNVPDLLQRHGRLEQGELSLLDHKTNQWALDFNERVFSAFKLHGVKVWVITEADRSSTTLLLPEEY